jgi:hypothetical protein
MKKHTMKHIKLLLFLFGIVVLLLFSCTKNSDSIDTKTVSTKGSNSKNVISNSDIMGIWVNTLNSKDVIRIFDFHMNRWDALASGFYHYYNYTIKSDSIIINYTGLYKVGTPPYHRKIYLNNSKDSLTIQNFHSVYPSNPGDTFIKISK